VPFYFLERNNEKEITTAPIKGKRIIKKDKNNSRKREESIRPNFIVQ